MVKTIRDNQFYFCLMALFTIVGGIYLCQSNKADAIFFFSENRTSFLNIAFRIITWLGEGPIYFLIGIAALAVRLRYSLLVAITGFTVLGLCQGLKAYFAIDRPMSYFAKQNLLSKLNLIEGVDMHSGATSFPSGHTLSAFALYSLLIFLMPSDKKFVALLFLLAFMVGISRIYLAQHFWPDVYAGAMMGSILAMIVFSVQSMVPNSSKLDRPLIRIGKQNAKDI